jgi:sugar phosphate isomerase/epimerase
MKPGYNAGRNGRRHTFVTVPGSGSFTVGLCYGTVMDAGLMEMIDAAGHAGFDSVSVSPGLYQAARTSGRTDTDLRRALDEQGLEVAMIDPLISVFPALPPIDSVSAFMQKLLSFGEEDCFAAAEALGSPLVAMAQPAGGEVPVAQMIDIVGATATRAATRGLRIGVEFIANSRGLGTLEVARAIVDGVNLSNVGLILDSWHIFRTGVDTSELAALPRARIGALQICDAPASAKAETPGILADRLLPGDGAMPLEEMLAALLTGTSGVDIGVEVFSQELRTLPPRAAAERAATRVRAVLARTPLPRRSV